MNPKGGLPGRGSNSNNNQVVPHLSTELLERLLPSFPLSVAGRDDGANNIGPNTGVVPVSEVELEPNMSPLSSLIATSQNPPSGDLLQQGATTSSAVSPITNAAQGQEEQVQVHQDNNLLDFLAKRNSREDASGESHQGESSNMDAGAAQDKRPETESNDSTNSNTVDPSPPLPVIPQIYQFFSETPSTEPISHVQQLNEEQVIPPPNPHVHRIADYGSGFQSPQQHQAGFYVSGASQYHNPFINGSNLSLTLPPYPYMGTNTMAPLHGQGSNISGHVGTSGYVDFNGRVRSAQTMMYAYHPLIEQAGLSISRPSYGSQGMNYPGAASSFRPQNYYNQLQISPPAIPSYISYGPSIMIPYIPPPEARSRLPYEIQFFLETLQHGGFPTFQIRSPIIGALQPDSRLSVETIIQHMERETFTFVDKEDPEEEREKCPICQEEFADGDVIGKLNLCMHKYHVHCIMQWLVESNVCPVCRRTAVNANNVQNEGGSGGGAGAFRS